MERVLRGDGWKISILNEQVDGKHFFINEQVDGKNFLKVQLMKKIITISVQVFIFERILE